MFFCTVPSLHRSDIHVILDFIPNYTSNQSAWFQASAADLEEYRNYYVWRDPANLEDYLEDPEGVEPIPPNNWVGGRSRLSTKRFPYVFALR